MKYFLTWLGGAALVLIACGLAYGLAFNSGASHPLACWWSGYACGGGAVGLTWYMRS